MHSIGMNKGAILMVSILHILYCYVQVLSCQNKSLDKNTEAKTLFDTHECSGSMIKLVQFPKKGFLFIRHHIQ